MMKSFRLSLYKIGRAARSNWPWKIIAVFGAFILWSYVVSTDTSSTLPRYITVKGSDIVLTGTKELADRSLALLSDPSAILDEIRVQIDVSRANYSRVTNENVQVELDLSTIRQKGVQEARLRSSSIYGRWIENIPPTVKVEIENLDSRNVPISTQFVGQFGTYQYTARSTNPAYVGVSGPASIVREVKQANVVVDVTGKTASTSSAELVTLVDANGDEITHPQLAKSTSSVIVNVDIFPLRNIAIDAQLAIVGTPAQGYSVRSVSLQPGRIEVSGKHTLLDEVDQLHVEPIDVTGATESFVASTSIRTINELSYATKEVLVSVEIVEDTVDRLFEGVRVTAAGEQEGLSYRLQTRSVDVLVTGPYSAVQSLSKDQISATVNVADYFAGDYDLAVELTAPQDDELHLEADPRAVRVTIS